MSEPEAAALALACLCAEDAYQAQGAAILQPALDARLAKDWTVRGFLLGTDSLWRKGEKMTFADTTVFYGWLLVSSTDASQYLCVIRGTQSAVEWFEDAEFEFTERPGIPGKVEHGFRALYESLALRQPGSLTDMPLVAALCGIVGTGNLTVAGHSLGAALAQFLTLDLASPQRLGQRVRGRFIACPRPGDNLYAQHFASSVADAKAFAFDWDLVPRVPLGLGYAAPLCTQTLSADGAPFRVCFSPECCHHALTYACLLSLASVDLSALPLSDKPYLDCIRLVS